MKKIILVLGISLYGSAFGQSPFYPQVYQDKFKQGRIESDFVKTSLRQILTKAHKKVSGGADELVDSCSVQDTTCRVQIVLSYLDARKNLFGKLHLEQDSKGHFVRDVYCHKEIRVRNPNDIPEDSVLNCEHTWPQSKFGSNYSKAMQKSDLHHLYPSDSKANSTRGNHPFANVDASAISKDCTESKLGSPTDIGADGRAEESNYFEPPAEHKGNVARAIFYFSTRYQMPVSEVQEAHLRAWHDEDPVDAEERDRNEAIMNIQGNRNPFIDYPHLVQAVDNF